MDYTLSEASLAITRGPRLEMRARGHPKHALAWLLFKEGGSSSVAAVLDASVAGAYVKDGYPTSFKEGPLELVRRGRVTDLGSIVAFYEEDLGLLPPGRLERHVFWRRRGAIIAVPVSSSQCKNEGHDPDGYVQDGRLVTTPDAACNFCPRMWQGLLGSCQDKAIQHGMPSAPSVSAGLVWVE